MGGMFDTEAHPEKGLSHVLESPKDGGTVKAIFVRPREGERMSLGHAYLSPEEGIQGDRWTSSGKICNTQPGLADECARARLDCRI